MPRKYDLSQLAVLVVDDNTAMLKIMRAILRAMGVGNVALANSAEAARIEMQVSEVDVIICDWMMEPESGSEFIRSIRNLGGEIRFIPVIVLTGHASAKLVGMARDAGADYTLAKPVSLEYVYRAFQHIRDGERSFVQVGTYFGPDRRRKSRPFEFADRRGGQPAAWDATPGARSDPPPKGAGARPRSAGGTWLVE